MMSLHFIIEFVALSRTGLESIGIIFHLGAIPVGCLFYLLWTSKRDPAISYIVFSILFVISLIIMILSQDSFTVVICLAVAGFSIAHLWSITMVILPALFDNPQYSGRMYFLATTGVSVFVIVDTLIISILEPVLHGIFLGAVLLIILLMFVVERKKIYFKPRSTPLRAYFQKKVFPSHVLLLNFFVAFFFINTYYTAVLFLGISKIESLLIFVLVLTFSNLIVSLFGGLLYDTIGRRWSILIGFYLEGLDFFLITLFPLFFEESVVLLLAFPLLCGIGLSLALYGGVLMCIELYPKNFTIIHSGTAFMAMGIGMVLALIIDTVLREFLSLIPIFMIFAYFTATILLFRVKEPLPSKTELEWRRKVEHILVLSKSVGLPIYSESLQKQDLEADMALAGGALIGISTIIREITRASELQIIKQKDYCIMLEHGTHILLAVMTKEELGTVREKMVNFVTDFEDFFEDFLEEWKGNLEVFKPAKKLVEKHFR
ncbi:MAG: MFS transporter [Candidatus Hodarchaeota archaeon]